MRFMTKIKYFVLAISILTFSACFKEVSETNDINNPSDSTGKLVKFAQIHVPDSFVYFQRNFTYEVNGKIKSITTIQRIKQTNGVITTLMGTTRFYRDASGRIERIGTDPDTASVNILLSYPSNTSIVPDHYKIVRTSAAETIVLDSAILTYSGSGRLRQATHFFISPTNQPDTGYYELLSFDVKKNLSGKKQYSDVSGIGKFEQVIAYDFEYDNKENPLYFDEIGYFLHDGVFGYTASPNNVIKQINTFLSFPSDQLNYTFTYNSLDRPLKSSKVLDTSNVSLYYYK